MQDKPSKSALSPDQSRRWLVNGTAAKGPLTPQDARDSVALVDAERKSVRTGKRVIIR